MADESPDPAAMLNGASNLVRAQADVLKAIYEGEAGLMTATGELMIDIAKAYGEWAVSKIKWVIADMLDQRLKNFKALQFALNKRERQLKTLIITAEGHETRLKALLNARDRDSDAWKIHVDGWGSFNWLMKQAFVPASQLSAVMIAEESRPARNFFFAKSPVDRSLVKDVGEETKTVLELTEWLRKNRFSTMFALPAYVDLDTLMRKILVVPNQQAAKLREIIVETRARRKEESDGILAGQPKESENENPSSAEKPEKKSDKK